MGTGENTPVEDVRCAIERAMFDPDAPMVELYYSGHGTSLSGDWCFENSQGKVTSFITFEEIVGMWRQARASCKVKEILFLNCDACFAGAWVTKAAKLADPTIVVRASCGDDELSYDTVSGGTFTKEFAKAVENNPKPMVSLRNKNLQELFLVGRPLPGTSKEQTPCMYSCRGLSHV